MNKGTPEQEPKPKLNLAVWTDEWMKANANGAFYATPAYLVEKAVREYCVDRDAGKVR